MLGGIHIYPLYVLAIALLYPVVSSCITGMAWRPPAPCRYFLAPIITLTVWIPLVSVSYPIPSNHTPLRLVRPIPPSRIGQPRLELINRSPARLSWMRTAFQISCIGGGRVWATSSESRLWCIQIIGPLIRTPDTSRSLRLRLSSLGMPHQFESAFREIQNQPCWHSAS